MVWSQLGSVWSCTAQQIFFFPINHYIPYVMGIKCVIYRLFTMSEWLTQHETNAELARVWNPNKICVNASNFHTQVSPLKLKMLTFNDQNVLMPTNPFTTHIWSSTPHLSQYVRELQFLPNWNQRHLVELWSLPRSNLNATLVACLHLIERYRVIPINDGWHVCCAWQARSKAGICRRVYWLAKWCRTCQGAKPERSAGPMTICFWFSDSTFSWLKWWRVPLCSILKGLPDVKNYSHPWMGNFYPSRLDFPRVAWQLVIYTLRHLLMVFCSKAINFPY